MGEDLEYPNDCPPWEKNINIGGRISTAHSESLLFKNTHGSSLNTGQLATLCEVDGGRRERTEAYSWGHPLGSRMGGRRM